MTYIERTWKRCFCVSWSTDVGQLGQHIEWLVFNYMNLDTKYSFHFCWAVYLPVRLRRCIGIIASLDRLLTTIVKHCSLTVNLSPFYPQSTDVRTICREFEHVVKHVVFGFPTKNHPQTAVLKLEKTIGKQSVPMVKQK